jgi:hypothetical protein
MLRLVAGKSLSVVSEPIIAIIASGKRPRNKFSNGFRKLLIRTSREIKRAIRVEISKKPK